MPPVRRPPQQARPRRRAGEQQLTRCQNPPCAAASAALEAAAARGAAAQPLHLCGRAAMLLSHHCHFCACLLCLSACQVRRSTYHEVLKLDEATGLLNVKGARNECVVWLCLLVCDGSHAAGRVCVVCVSHIWHTQTAAASPLLLTTPVPPPPLLPAAACCCMQACSRTSSTTRACSSCARARSRRPKTAAARRCRPGPTHASCAAARSWSRTPTTARCGALPLLLLLLPALRPAVLCSPSPALAVLLCARRVPV